MTNDQTVTQADREAAVELLPMNTALELERAMDVRSGRRDGDATVQAFARHRLAHSGEAERWERIAAQRLVEISDKLDEIVALRERVGALEGAGRSVCDRQATPASVNNLRTILNEGMMPRTAHSGEGRSNGTGEDGAYAFAARIAKEVVPDDADGYAVEGEWKAAWFLARDAALAAYEALADGDPLRKYVQHLPACRLNVRMGKPCECGLSEALAGDPDHPAENKAGGLWYQRWLKSQEELRELRAKGEVERPDAEEDDRSWLGTSIDRIDAMEEASQLRDALGDLWSIVHGCDLRLSVPMETIAKVRAALAQPEAGGEHE